MHINHNYLKLAMKLGRAYSMSSPNIYAFQQNYPRFEAQYWLGFQ